MPDKMQLLRAFFGYDSFRPGQEAVVDALTGGRDVLSIMPTGGGKSLCFQLPALLTPGITLVVSPLISLMKDQVGSLIQAGVPAAYLNSSLTERQYALALDRAWQGRYKLIYVAPERLESPAFLRFAQHAAISLLAVDEAHCVSQWGTDFRPSYLRIPHFLESLPKRPPVGAFTATATPEVRADIVQKLALHTPVVQVTGFDRENLSFEVRHPQDKRAELLSLLEGFRGESGVVYCSTRKTVEEVADFLTGHGIPALRYHAGLPLPERQESQERFAFADDGLIVATNAFGMGIDKSNVRYVIHYNMPLDLESYYQEAGRAGRDGEAARCILLYGGRDIMTARFLLEHSQPPEGVDPQLLGDLRAKQMERLQRMIGYCTTTQCLRAYLLRYFGEKPPKTCGNCSNCLGNFETVDVTREARAVLDAVESSGCRFGPGAIAALLLGQETEQSARWHLERLDVFGRLAGVPAKKVRAVMDALTEQGYLQHDAESPYPVLIPGPNAAALRSGSAAVSLRRARDHAPARRPRPAPSAAGPVDEALFQRLRELRSTLARRKGVPAYVIFSDKTLREMAAVRPATRAQLAQISGVGSHKLSLYGDAFLELLRQ
ncbi:DNA helicase RecQ [Pseudoflavonifractor phocaeensis]|uniref:DNA helicase RecQ n=1 Tax=Pseudoflavonifractor phocaeensis TaxID=1870988 RepID=UPI001958F16E|nr:DNA helicase RecQ [Pseudoflavonifractor phocaeensis]MBM6869290.1 DNA helicase RecQ [Pseudoflavonifractor phocaeensis]